MRSVLPPRDLRPQKYSGFPSFNTRTGATGVNRTSNIITRTTLNPLSPCLIHIHPTIKIQPPPPNIPPKEPDTNRKRRSHTSNNGRKNQRIAHIQWRVRVAAGLERILNQDENRAEQLPRGPADGAPDLRGKGVCDFDEVFEDDGEESEGGGAEEGHYGVGGRDPCGAGGGEDEAYVCGCDDGDEGADCAEVVLVAVCEGGEDGGGDEADDDEDPACDAGLSFGEVVGGEDLVDEGGDAVEEADVDAEGDEDEPELEGLEELRDGGEEGGFGCGG